MSPEVIATLRHGLDLLGQRIDRYDYDAVFPEDHGRAYELRTQRLNEIAAARSALSLMKEHA